MGSGGVFNETMIAQGNTAQIFSLGEDKILKLFVEGFPREAVVGEYNNSRIAARALSLVPKVYELTERDGRQGIVFERVTGEDLLEKMLRDPKKMGLYAREFARYHAKIGQKVTEPMRTVKEKLRYEIGHETNLAEEEKETVLRALNALPDGDRLCHGDFHPGNVMAADKGAYLIDWMTAAKGDPAADAARTLILLRYGEPMHIGFFKLLLIRFGMNRLCSAYLKEFCTLTGIGKDRIKEWTLPVAAARLDEGMTEHERQILVKLVRKELKKR